MIKHVLKPITALLLTIAIVFMLIPAMPAQAVSITQGEITGSGVALRKSAGYDGEVLARLKKGTSVKIAKTNVNAEWYKVSYSGISGYVNRAYIDWDSSLYNLDYSATVVNVNEYVNVRKEPSSGAALLGKAKKGESYDVLATNVEAGWHKISYNGKNGYVSSKYLSLRVQAKNNQLTGISIAGGTMAPRFAPAETGYMVTTRNSAVTINVSANSGVRVKINGKTGKTAKVNVPAGTVKTVRISVGSSGVYSVYIMRGVVTVGTWNIKRGNGHLQEQGRIVRDQMPDIMALQETYKTESGSINNVLSLKTKWMTNGRFCTTLDQSNGDYGHGLLTHYKIISSDTYKLSSPGVEQRYVSKAVLNVNGNRVSFYNTHLSYNSKELRAKQFGEIAALMRKDSNKYKILTGDFNAAYAEFAQLGDYTVVNTPDTKYYDYKGKAINVNEIDNIIVSKNIKVVSTRMIRTSLSDHYPVFAYLVFK